MLKKTTVISIFAIFLVLFSGCSASAPPTEENKSFELSSQGKDFLTEMCKELEDFNSQADMDSDFWKSFLFLSYTGLENAETEQIHRADLGFDETVVKISLTEAEDRAMLVFGKELPDIKPAFEDMEAGQTSLFYKEGYYYIGVSDFPDYRYTFDEMLGGDEPDTYVAKYNIAFEDKSNAGTVSFLISPADNENGFIILSKTANLELQ